MYIYCSSIIDLNWRAIEPQKKILNPTSLQQLEQFKFDQDKCRSLVGKMLLLYILKKHESYQTNTLPPFIYNAYKKPSIPFIKGNFNISHSHDWVICGYTEKHEIGVDIEKKTPLNINDYQEVLTQKEYHHFKNKNDFDFFQLWTLKEAIMKAEGSGFFLTPNSFELPHPFHNNTHLNIKGKNWFLYSQNFEQEYVLSIASSYSIQPKPKITIISPLTLRV